MWLFCISSNLFPDFPIMLFVLTYVYCIYGPVSPWKFKIVFQSKISSLILLFDKSLNITAPIPTFFATSSLFSSSGFFVSITVFALCIASSSKSSSFTTVPSLVDIFPVGRRTIPNETCSNPFVYFSSIPNNFAVSNTCLKCKFCSYDTTYKALSKSYVLDLYKIAARSRVAYVVESFDFFIIIGVFIPLSSKLIIFAPCDSSNLPVFSNMSITSCILSE